MSTSESVLRAAPGDRLVIKSHHVGEPERDAEVLEARGEHFEHRRPAKRRTSAARSRGRGG
jgi:Domain of unknown function (DUF1918)